MVPRSILFLSKVHFYRLNSQRQWFSLVWFKICVCLKHSKVLCTSLLRDQFISFHQFSQKKSSTTVCVVSINFITIFSLQITNKRYAYLFLYVSSVYYWNHLFHPTVKILPKWHLLTIKWWKDLEAVRLAVQCKYFCRYFLTSLKKQ